MASVQNHTWIFPVFSYLLVGSLAYGSQVLFLYIGPHHLTVKQTFHFNIVVLYTFIGYTRSWLTDPGRVPSGWQPTNKAHRSRWCRKCDAFKPARAHHCKTCGRCIPKMDHHCPWTVNCVSHTTLPHFLRFLFFGLWSVVILENHLFIRLGYLWSNRDLPSYLGPSAWAMGALFYLVVVNSITGICIGILFIRCLWSLFSNVTSIESWEIERHGALLRRARVLGGYLDGPDGKRMRIRKQEFPYDIGFWSNFTQVFGINPLTWLWPLASTPSSESGLEFAVNGFEDDDTVWPPPDPDRMPRTLMNLSGKVASLDEGKSDQQRKEAFSARKSADMTANSILRRRRFHERYGELESHEELSDPLPNSREDGEESWMTSEGERLADFGLDELAEFYDEDDTPLAELLGRGQRQQI